MRTRKLLSYGVMAVMLAVVFVAYSQRRNLYDWWRLQNYTAPAAVEHLADNTAMNGYMRRVFYANHPDIEDKATFNSHCRENEQTIVLGCFIDNQGIYLLKVDDERLDGVEEVTAAHETLHAVYARLSTNDKKKLDKQLNDAFNNLHDPELTNTIDLYRKKDPKIVSNELHSILGTEVRNLPPELEQHYQKYFTNRLKVVGFAEQYKQVYIDERNQVIDYDAQLTALKVQIDDKEKQLTVISADLDKRRDKLNQLKNSGQYDQYNAAIPGYNSAVSSYNTQVSVLKGYISDFNTIVPKRNAIANEQQELVNAIDSREIQEK